MLWYEHTFDIPSDWQKDDFDVLLHFGAVDYRCTLWLNGQEVGHNQGGHVPFFLDVTPYLQKNANRLVMRVEDAQDPHQPRGKQVVSGHAGGVDYTNTSGIWQSVWLELTPSQRIESLRITPRAPRDAAQDALDVEVFLHAPAIGWRVEVEVFDGLLEAGAQPELVTRVQLETSGAAAMGRIPLPYARRWSPSSPHLYGLRVRLRPEASDTPFVDEIISYAGIRSVALKTDGFYLNGERLFLAMVLDQGYWPDGGMTAPTDQALRADVEWCKALGFNGVRKHQKVEDPRWLYHCDRLGLLVWGEMANARALSPQSQEWFLSEWERVVRRDFNHPCIVTWVPHNETWGLPSLKEFEHLGEYDFIERTVNLTRRLDLSRPVVDNDGWQHSDITDILTIHEYAPNAQQLRERLDGMMDKPRPGQIKPGDYPYFAQNAKYRGQPIMLTEVGGFFLLPTALPREKRDALYEVYGCIHSAEELVARYRDLMEGIASLGWVSGFCYTQLVDVEQEINGLLSFDRQPKAHLEAIAAIHRAVFGVGWENQ